MPADQKWMILISTGSSDVEVKKSHFLGELKRCRSEEEATEFIAEIRRKHRDARHHCFAMRIGKPGNVFERSSDDGEPQGTAGKPMLDLLKGACLYDVCAVVTRYFGGTLLGTGGLVHAYSDALKEALNASESAELKEGYRIALRCDYALANKIRRAAASMELYTMEENYGADCELVYLVPAEEAGQFERKVTELSAGQAETGSGMPVMFYGIEKPAIYT